MSVTIQQVAQEAGVSVATVSRVVNNRPGRISISASTRDSVLSVVERMKYRPNANARAFRRRRSQQLGLVVPDLAQIVPEGHAFADPNLSEVLSGIEEKVTEKGYRLTLLVANEQFLATKSHLALARDGSVDGLLLWGLGDKGTLIEDILQEDISCVQVRSCIRSRGAKAVICDDRGGVRMVTEHLLSLGHRVFGHLRGPEDVAVSAERTAGFQKAIQGHDVDVVEHQFSTTGCTEEAGYISACRLLERKPEITGIVAFNDLVAIGAYRAAREKGLRIPEDISVVGGDGISACAYVTPTLTTFRIPNHEIGTEAAEWLIDIVEDKETNTSTEANIKVKSTEIKLGGSCASPRRA